MVTQTYPAEVDAQSTAGSKATDADPKLGADAKPEPTAKATSGRTPSDTKTTLLQLLEQARQGRLEVLPQLRRALDKNPHLWRTYGDLGRMAEEGCIHSIYQGDRLAGQSCHWTVEQMKRDIAGPSPSPLDQLLAQQIAVCWLAAKREELREGAADKKDGTGVAKLRLQRTESANRRLLGACKALAQVRRLMQGLKVEIIHTTPTPPKAAPEQAVGETAMAPELACTQPSAPVAVPSADPASRIQELFAEAKKIRDGALVAVEA